MFSAHDYPASLADRGHRATPMQGLMLGALFLLTLFLAFSAGVSLTRMRQVESIVDDAVAARKAALIAKAHADENEAAARDLFERAKAAYEQARALRGTQPQRDQRGDDARQVPSV